ncbi:hypothetical protein [Sphingobacterium hungaricum]
MKEIDQHKIERKRLQKGIKAINKKLAEMRKEEASQPTQKKRKNNI